MFRSMHRAVVLASVALLSSVCGAATPVATAPVATTPVATAPVATAPVATTPVATTPVATAPDFSLNDLAGHSVHLSDYRGKLVLLNFWASWCAPCREEMPRFSQWQRNYGARGLRVIGVSMDDDAKSARQFLTHRPVSYPIVMGDEKLGASFGGILGLPTSYLIDAQGHIVARYQGESSLKKMESQIQVLLAEMAR